MARILYSCHTAQTDFCKWTWKHSKRFYPDVSTALKFDLYSLLFCFILSLGQHGAWIHPRQERLVGQLRPQPSKIRIPRQILRVWHLLEIIRPWPREANGRNAQSWPLWAVQDLPEHMPDHHWDKAVIREDRVLESHSQVWLICHDMHQQLEVVEENLRAACRAQGSCQQQLQ